MTVTHKKLAWLVGVVLVFIALVTPLFKAYDNVEKAAATRQQSMTVVESASQLMSLLIDAETSQRGYLLTGDEIFLTPYTAAVKVITPDLAKLNQMTVTSAARQHLNALGPLVAAELADLSALIAQGRNASLSRANQDLRLREGKQQMDLIRAEMAEFVRLEKVALEARELEFDATMRHLFGLILLTSVIALLFATFFILVIYRQMAQGLKNLVHLETQSLNAGLEAKNSELIQANVALKESEEKLAVTLNSIGDGVIATDVQGRVTLLNPVAQQLTGWVVEQALGRHVNDIFHIFSKESREAKTVPVGETLLHGTLQGLANHTLLIARDGREFDIADSCAPIRDADGLLIGAVLVFRDVTRVYAAQQALNDSRAMVQTILNTVGDGIITVLAHGNIIQSVNPKVETMFGYSSAELVGEKFSLLLPELDLSPGQVALDAYGENDEGRGHRVLGRRKGGHDFHVELVVNEMLLNGQRYFAGVVRDITVQNRIEIERVLLDQALQHKNVELQSARAVAEKSNLAKSDFLSSMSHELRTPLGAILGFAQLLESGTPLPTPSQKRSIDQILTAGWYLLELINEILDLALIESGKMALSLEPVSLVEVLHECESMMETQAQKRGIRLTFAHLKSSYFVLADRTRVKQVLINLLSNAIKYNKVGGTVEVSCVPSPPDSIRICVRDTGYGLTTEQLAQLFQAFNRLGSKPKEEGTGIGLVVCKRLVELMNGEIGVSSQVNVGSEFWFDLRQTQPLLVASHVQEPLALTQVPPRESVQVHTLLYVEDNPANLMLVKDLVARRPHLRLLSAIDGNQGIELARAAQPDVILMDINLPGISGVKALKVLANDPTTAHIPVIAISANAMPRDIEKGMEAGFFRYLTKPIKVADFMDTMDVALEFAKIQAAIVETKE